METLSFKFEYKNEILFITFYKNILTNVRIWYIIFIGIRMIPKKDKYDKKQEEHT